jgi:hypothetical protein
MLRITSRTTPDGFVLKLEGWLSGAWVRELDLCWRAIALEGQYVSVDLGDVCFVDAGGRELLTSMYRAGVAFVTKGCDMPELVREIRDSSAAGRT